MKGLMLVIVGLGLALGFAGCSKRPTTKPTPGTSTAVPADSGTSAVGANGSGGATPLPGATLGSSAADAGTTLATVYFALDSAEVGSQYDAQISTAARKLLSSPTLRLRLEGNTDERGAAEYNIGLGERRAQAVKRALVLAGAPDGQLLTVSYGAERPAAEGHDETAWAKNRRVDVVAIGGSP